MPESSRHTSAPAELAAAESAFAAQSVREGMRAAFLAWLAPDATLFRPGPVNGPAAIAANPDPPIVLAWRPAFVEVAASGELGLSTGPWKITSRSDPAAAPRFGQFVSVWKRGADGSWRVHVDLGISHPGPALADAPLEAHVTPAVARDGPAATIAMAEADFARRAGSSGDAQAYAHWLSPSARLYREGNAPFLGRQAALASPAARSDRITWTVERHETGASGDFGYAMGRYAPANGQTSGHFVRVWRREAAGWRIALDVVNALPPR
jgi:ketosteroid isomerase-like protein